MEPNKKKEPLPLDFIQSFSTLKWSQKCEIIESLAKQLSNTSITNYEYDAKTLFDFISKGIKEANLKVNSAFFQLLIIITPQLSSNNEFKYEILDNLPVIVDKFKEKKEKLNSEILQILTLLLKNNNIDICDLFNSLRNFPSEKSIQYKQSLSEFFFINLRKTYKDILIKSCSVAIDIFRNLISESNIEIRNCAISSLALLKKRLRTVFDDNEETLKINDNNILAEIEEVSKNISYDPKFDLNEDEEEIEIEEEIEVEEEVEEEVKEDEENHINNSKQSEMMKEIQLNKQHVNEEKENKLNTHQSYFLTDKDKATEVKEKANEQKKNKPTNDTFIEIIIPHNKKEKLNEESTLPIIRKSSNNMKDNTKGEIEIQNNNTITQLTPLKDNKELMNITRNTNNTTINLAPQNNRESIKINKKRIVKKEINTPKSKEQMLNDIDLIPLPGSGAIMTNESDKEGEATKGIDEFQRKIDEALRKEEEKMHNNEVNQSTLIQPKKQKKKNEEDEEYSQKAEGLLDKNTIDLIESSKWDEKKQGLTLLNEYLKSNSLKPIDRDTLFIYIKHRINNFKETNFNILKEAYLCLTTMELDKTHVSIVLNGIFEKLADPKLKETLNGLLIKMLETLGIEFILTQLLTLIEKSSKMQVIKEYAAFIEKAIEDYGHEKVPIKEVVNMCKTMAANTNPQVRTSATSLLCVLYKFVGNDIKVLIKDIKESTLKIIEAEFENIQVIDPKTIKAKKGNQLEITSTPIQKIELIPRVDISKKLTQKLLNDINNAKWTEKKEAIESIEKIIQEANMKIVNIGLDPLFNTIKVKLCDGNKNLVRAIVQLLTKLIQAVDNGFKQHTKTVALNLIGNLADKMQLLRDDCQLCIDEWIKAVGFEAFIIFTPSFLKQDNFDMRNELMKIMTKNSDKFQKSFAKNAFKELIPSFLICLQDKSVAIRNQVEDLIKISLKFISVKNYFKAINEFKPAIAETLKSIIERVSNEIGPDLQQVQIEEKTPTKERPKQTEVIKKIPVKLSVNQNKGVSKTPSKKDSFKQPSNTAEPQKEKKKVTTSNIKPKKLRMGRIPVSVKDDLACCSVILNTKTTLLEDKKQIENNNIFLSQYKLKSNAKERRYEMDKKSKFNLESGIYDYIKTLKDQFKYIFTSEFIIKLFNDDCNKIITAIGLIMKSIENEESKDKTIDNMDLLLKQLGWKVSSNQNPSLQKKVFGLCERLHKVYSNPNIHFNGTEINILLNIFTDKMGSTNTGIRETAKNLINKFINVITPQKSFNVLIHLIDYKPNLKIKNEILEICNALYSSGEIENLGNAKIAKAIMKAYSSGDFALKNKLLNLVKEVYSAIGEEIWKYAEMSEKDKDDLYDKLEVFEEEEEGNEDQEEDDNNLSEAQKISSEFSGNTCDTEMNNELFDDSYLHPSTEEELRMVLNSLTEQSNNDKIKSMIALHDIIYKNYSFNEKMLFKSIDNIVSTFVSVLSCLFKDKAPKDISIKYSKYIVTVLNKIVSLKNLIAKVSYVQLRALINIVLSSLLIEKLAELGENNEGVLILRTLNSIMLKLIENCQPTDMILILFEIVKDYRNDERNGKICELGVKCLFRISNDKDSVYQNLALDKILRSIHELLVNYEQTHPDLQIKTKIDQIIINYIKNFLKELVIIRKESITEAYIIGVESHGVTDKYIKRWIKGTLELLNKDKQNSVFAQEEPNNNSSSITDKTNQQKTTKSHHEQMAENKIKLEQIETKRPLTSQQNEKLSQLKQKLTNFNGKGTPNSSQSHSNYNTVREPDNKIPVDQNNYKTNYKSFNQIQKKWNDVNKRTQHLATIKFDSKQQSKK